MPAENHEWFELSTGNWMWVDDERKIRAVVYSKKTREWSWIVNVDNEIQNLPNKQRAGKHTTANKAKAEIDPILQKMAKGISWEDATS